MMGVWPREYDGGMETGWTGGGGLGRMTKEEEELIGNGGRGIRTNGT